MDESVEDETMVNARFRIQLPTGIWVSHISKAFPNAEFRLLTGFKTEEGAVELGEVIAENSTDINAAVRTHPSILEHKVLNRTDNRILTRYRTTDTELYEFVSDTSAAPTFPITVIDGWCWYDLTINQAVFKHIQSTLEESDLSFELISIIRHLRPDQLLSDRQIEVLSTAIQMGYYEVPRDCTLQELASSLDADKSTVSEILRRGDSKVLKWYLIGPTSN